MRKFLLMVIFKKEMGGKIPDEKTIEGICDADWEELRILEIISRSEPCPLRQVSPQGVRYCTDSDLSNGRCPYNSGEEVLLSAEPLPGGMEVQTTWRHRDSREMGEFLSAVDSKNRCTYRLSGEQESKPILSS